MTKPTLHIYPAYGPGWATPKVYALTVSAGDTVGDQLARAVPQAIPRNDIFEAICEPRIRSRFDDIVLHNEILHPSM